MVNSSMISQARPQGNPPTFIDLFAGCGGLSLGLSQAGFQGVFAIERAVDAFETFELNFLDKRSRHPFKWPKWLEKQAHSIDDVIDNKLSHLRGLREKIDVIAGGPPCQGFSFAGKRSGADPRNQMFERYVHLVDLIRPKILVLENVPGMKIAHSANSRGKAKRAVPTSYYERLVESLAKIQYTALGRVLNASAFGVPQRRPRLVVIGVRNDLLAALPEASVQSLFSRIDQGGREFMHQAGFRNEVSAKDAISDLETRERGTVACTDPASRKGFREPKYSKPTTRYQRLMHDRVSIEDMDSMRLANHRTDVRKRFDLILRCTKGKNLSEADRLRLGMRKHRTVPMDPEQPAPTLTTLPDDVLHYLEPRILSVRECARLQSFPDWFLFRGKYTTGGERRRTECPRYTQVGNAVPPLLAKGIGEGVKFALERFNMQQRGAKRDSIELVELVT